MHNSVLDTHMRYTDVNQCCQIQLAPLHQGEEDGSGGAGVPHGMTVQVDGTKTCVESA
jgi:hypothetical protein